MSVFNAQNVSQLASVYVVDDTSRMRWPFGMKSRLKPRVGNMLGLYAFGTGSRFWNVNEVLNCRGPRAKPPDSVRRTDHSITDRAQLSCVTNGAEEKQAVTRVC
jgi:hypothetical protein